jgi:glycosyltransferase involved in cell wall biosynthesis
VENDLPRTLVVGPNAFNLRFGGGITLSRLFGGWPKDRIAQAHADALAPDRSVCEQFYLLNGAMRPAPNSAILRHSRWLLGFLAGRTEYAFIWPRFTSALSDWIADFQPELIFAQPASLALLRLSRMIALRRDVPLVVHVSDDWAFDWPASRIRRRLPPFTSWLAATTRREFARFVRDAVARLCISDAMATALQERCGVPFDVFGNAVDPAQWPEPAPAAPLDGGRPFRLLYSGSLYSYTQLHSLVDVAQAVVAMNRSDARRPRVTLEIATDPSYERYRSMLEAPPAVSVTRAVPIDELPAKLAAADALVLPVNFDAHSLDFARYSMPGKLTEYLMSGRPILAYGPAEAAPIEYALREGFAAVVTDRHQRALTIAIDELSASAELRQRLGSTARRLAEERHSLPTAQRRFRQIIRRAAVS